MNKVDKMKSILKTARDIMLIILIILVVIFIYIGIGKLFIKNFNEAVEEQQKPYVEIGKIQNIDSISSGTTFSSSSCIVEINNLTRSIHSNICNNLVEGDILYKKNSQNYKKNLNISN